VANIRQKFNPTDDYCNTCGSDLKKIKKIFKLNKTIFCSKECKNIWKDAENNPIKRKEELT